MHPGIHSLELDPGKPYTRCLYIEGFRVVGMPQQFLLGDAMGPVWPNSHLYAGGAFFDPAAGVSQVFASFHDEILKTHKLLRHTYDVLMEEDPVGLEIFCSTENGARFKERVMNPVPVTRRGRGAA